MTIPIIRVRRNLLDVYLSKLKHKTSKLEQNTSDALKAHCSVHASNCIKQHMKMMKHGITVPNVTTDLVQTLRESVDQETLVDDMLRSSNIPVVFVSYDELYYPTTLDDKHNASGTTTTTKSIGIDKRAKEWNRILQFLFESDFYPSRQGRLRVTWENVTLSMTHAATTASRWHDDLIANFDEVYMELKGTELESLLRFRPRTA